MTSLAEILPPETLYDIKCGAGRFTIDENDTVTQYDHLGVVVGIFRASDTPSLRAWIAQRSAPSEHRGRQMKIAENPSPRN